MRYNEIKGRYIMLIENDIDLKAYYRFVEFLLKLVKYDLPHERFKNIIL